MGAFRVPIQPVKAPSVIAFQKSRSSGNARWQRQCDGVVIAFQKSRSSCNFHLEYTIVFVVIAFQKSRSSCNYRSVAMGAAIVIAYQESRSSRSEEHTSELQSLLRISYAVFCLNKIIMTYIARREYHLALV